MRVTIVSEWVSGWWVGANVKFMIVIHLRTHQRIHLASHGLLLTWI